jgi:ubiquinone/menaquinone biosynthesis C-methylase UbiE
MQLPALPILGRNFRARFHAWWEGYEFSRPPVADEDAEDDAEKISAASSAKDPWPRERIEIAQMLWGREFVSPIGSEMLGDLVAPLAFGKGMSLVHLGCGVGGGTRALVRAHGVKATGLEPNATLAQSGMELSNAARLKAEAPIAAIDFASVEMKPALFDRAVAEYVLSALGDKEGALKRVLPALKPGARVLILDLVLAGKAGPAVAAWGRADPSPVKPWTLDAAHKALAKLKIAKGETKDETPRFAAAIVQGLDRFLRSAESQAMKRTLTATLKREVDLWLARKAALDAGEVKAYAIYGTKSA